jgi:hypothetical protein
LPAEGHALGRPEGRELVEHARALAVGHERLGAVRVVVFAQRVPLELGVRQDAPQVGVAPEPNAHQVERLALEPVGAVPQPGQRLDLGPLALGVADARLGAQPVLLRQRVEVADDLDAGLAVGVVDPAQVHQEVHLARGLVAQESVRVEPARGVEHDRLVAVLAVALEHDRPERPLHDVDQRLAHRPPPARFGAPSFGAPSSSGRAWPSARARLRSVTSWPCAGSVRGLTTAGVRSPR